MSRALHGSKVDICNQGNYQSGEDLSLVVLRAKISAFVTPARMTKQRHCKLPSYTGSLLSCTEIATSSVGGRGLEHSVLFGPWPAESC